MFQYILDQSISCSRPRALAFEAIRRLVVRFGDPVVSYRINGRTVAINLAHEFPRCRWIQPSYSANLTRLCAFLREEFGILRMIDVGANVGDSYCLAEPRPSDAYLLIEGDARYFSLLERNTRSDPAVRRVRALVSDKATSSGALLAENGNARVVPTADTEADDAPWITLDAILDADAVFAAPHLLKTDVEGFDTRVLMGARGHIARTSPVLFFEHYPRLLRQAGDSDTAIFAELARRGYSEAILYDNLGSLVATAATSDEDLVGRLVSQARRKRKYYYDVCCFPDVFASARQRFIEAERRIASGRLPAR